MAGGFRKNYSAVDVAKLFFCVCVVITHTKTIRYLPTGIRGIVNALVIRSLVPFFFITSGFFLYQNVQLRGAPQACRKYVTRMLQPLIIFETIGELLYIGFKLYRGDTIPHLIRNVLREVVFYPRASMWFLQACIVGCILLNLFYRKNSPMIIPVLVGCPLFSFALLCNNYRFLAEVFGIGKHADWFLKHCISARNGVFYGFLFMAIGGAIAQYRLIERIDGRAAWVLLVMAYFLYYREMVMLRGRMRADDGSLFISQIFAVPLLFIVLCRFKGSIPFSSVCRRYSTGIFYLQKIVLYIVECIFILRDRDLPPIVAFTVVMFFCILICNVSYRVPNDGRFLQ